MFRTSTMLEFTWSTDLQSFKNEGTYLVNSSARYQKYCNLPGHQICKVSQIWNLPCHQICKVSKIWNLPGHQICKVSKILNLPGHQICKVSKIRNLPGHQICKTSGTLELRQQGWLVNILKTRGKSNENTTIILLSIMFFF